MGLLEGKRALITGDGQAQAEFITGTTLLVDGGMTAGYLQRERG